MSYTQEIIRLKIDEKLKEQRIISKENQIPVISDEGLNLLLLNVAIKAPKRILEIGTATGCSGIAMLNTSKISCLYTIEKDIDSFNVAKQNFKEFNVDDRVKQFLGDADFVLSCLVETEKFDFIFLDGPKSQYKNYAERLICMLNYGGVLFCDNVLFRGYVNGENETPKNKRSIVNNLKIFLEMINNDERLITSVLNCGDGISISVRR